MTAPEPIHRSKHVGAARPETLDGWAMTVDGLVNRPLRLTVDELAALGEPVTLTSDVNCPDGIGTRGATYVGVPLGKVLEIAGVGDDGLYACVHSGPFIAAFTIESIERREGILAYERNGQQMSWDDGGPIRLVVAKGACFDTVKWVERVSIERDGSSATAVSIIRQRRGLGPGDTLPS